MKPALALLAVALAVAAIALVVALREQRRPLEKAPSSSGAIAPPESDSPPSSEAKDSDSALVLRSDGSAPGRVRVEAPPYRFEVSARGYRSGPDGIVFEGVTVRNATTSEAFEVRLYALGPGLAPGGDRAVIGDIEAEATSEPSDLAFPIAIANRSETPIRFYLAYRVAAEEPTWLLSGTHAIILRDGTGG